MTPNEILAARYNRLLTRLLSMKGFAPAPVLVPEIQAVLALEADRPEWEFLKGGRRGMGFGALAVVTGQVNHIALVNPANSGVLAVAYIEEIFDSVGSATIAMIRDTTLGIPTAVSTRGGVDTRQIFISGGNLACTVETQQAGTPLTPRVEVKFIVAAATVSRHRYGPFILSPGFGVMVHSSDDAAGQSTFASFDWIERALEVSELLDQGT